MIRVVEASWCAFNHHQVKFAFVSNFIVVGASSVPRDLTPTAKWLWLLVISQLQYQTKTTFTTWTQLHQFFTSSRHVSTRPRPPSPPEHNSTSSLPAQDTSVLDQDRLHHLNTTSPVLYQLKTRQYQTKAVFTTWMNVFITVWCKYHVLLTIDNNRQ